MEKKKGKKKEAAATIAIFFYECALFITLPQLTNKHRGYGNRLIQHRKECNLFAFS